jgi:outer membrane protein assembly factor BamE
MTASLPLRLSLLVLILLTGLSGCSVTRTVSSDIFKPYVPEVVQGNFVSREQRQYLRAGLTRAQVRDVLGTPLVTSVFHADRWDYTFSIRRQGVASQQFRLTLRFKGDVLDQIDGDELPSEAEFAQRLTQPTSGVKVPALEASEEQLAKFPANRANATAVTNAPAPALLPATYPPLESAPR